MPTDEQRMRREFEAWAEGVDLSPDFAAEREKCPDDPTHGWNYGKLTAWEAWQARDAEAQRLVAALTSMVVRFDPNSENEIAAHKNAVMLLAEYLPEKEVADAD